MFSILIKISLTFVPNGKIDNNQASIGLDNGLAPNGRQAIIWINPNPFNWRIYAALWGDELICAADGIFQSLANTVTTDALVLEIFFKNI